MSQFQGVTHLETYLNTLTRFGIKPGLERIRALLARVGNPQLAYPLVLVGGTNGKGSTCEFLARTLAREGHRVGLYTSPHLYRWNERIRVLDESTLPTHDLFPGAISDAELDSLFDAARPHLQTVTDAIGPPTEFETLTFLGLWHFARQPVDAAVIEVGLGGTWDATNVTEPAVSVVTRIALDHTAWLGDTLEAIARDKVGIARRGRPFLTAEANPDTLRVLQEECAQRDALFQHIDTSDVSPADFQTKNARLADAAYAALCAALGWSYTPSTPQYDEPPVPGRFEIVQRNPLVILDGANNPDGARTLAARLQQELNGRALTLVFGVSSDKDWREMLEVLAPLAKHLILTQADHPRALPASELAEAARTLHPHVEAIVPVPAAFERALAITPANDAICITGSFFVLGDLTRDTLKK